MGVLETVLTWVMIFSFFIITNIHIEKTTKETQALILEYQSKLTAVETEKQKTIADFLRSVTGRGEEVMGYICIIIILYFIWLEYLSYRSLKNVINACNAQAKAQEDASSYQREYDRKMNDIKHPNRFEEGV